MNANDLTKLVEAFGRASSGEDVVIIGDVQSASIGNFFRKYGTTEKKFEFVSDGASFLNGFEIGYVKLGGSSEKVAVIKRGREGVMVACFSPPRNFEGGDILTLISKSEFINSIKSKIS